MAKVCLRDNFVELYIGDRDNGLTYTNNSKNILFAAYEYHRARYEGSGIAVVATNRGWFVHNMSHCSCYGPFERLYLDGKPYAMTHKELLEIKCRLGFSTLANVIEAMETFFNDNPLVLEHIQAEIGRTQND